MRQRNDFEAKRINEKFQLLENCNNILPLQLSRTFASPSETSFLATLSASSGLLDPRPIHPYSLPVSVVWLTVHNTVFPTSNFLRYSLDSHAIGSSLAGIGFMLLGVGLRAILGASISERAIVRSGGGPFLGCPLTVMNPPS